MENVEESVVRRVGGQAMVPRGVAGRSGYIVGHAGSSVIRGVLGLLYVELYAGGRNDQGAGANGANTASRGMQCPTVFRRPTP